MKVRFLITAVFTVATLSAANVEAQVACGTSDVLFGGSLGATKCYGSFFGNDVPNNFPTIKAWFEAEDTGTGIWGTLGKSDESNVVFGAVSSGSTGTINLANAIWGTFGLSIKEGNFYSAYLWENVALANAADFFTYETPNGHGLSHATLWDAEGDFEGDFVEVPEPASFAMMFVGLAGLGVAARRRRKV